MDIQHTQSLSPNLPLTTSRPSKFSSPYILRHGSTIRILIVGIDQAENQFSRAITNYGFTPVHFSTHSGQGKKIPLDCDAVLTVRSHTSHERYWEAREAYKALGKPTFNPSHGFTEIKEEFEKIFIENIREETSKLKFLSKCSFFVGKFYRVGERFNRAEFAKMIEAYHPGLSTSNLGNWFAKAVETGSLTKNEKVGTYTFQGLTKGRALKIKGKIGVNLPGDWLIDSQKVEKPDLMAEVPEAPVIETKAEPTPVPTSSKAQPTHEDIALLVQTVSDLDAKVTVLTAQLEGLLRIFNPELLKAPSNAGSSRA